MNVETVKQADISVCLFWIQSKASWGHHFEQHGHGQLMKWMIQKHDSNHQFQADTPIFFFPFLFYQNQKMITSYLQSVYDTSSWYDGLLSSLDLVDGFVSSFCSHLVLTFLCRLHLGAIFQVYLWPFPLSWPPLQSCNLLQQREICCADVTWGTELPYIWKLLSAFHPSQFLWRQTRTGFWLLQCGEAVPLGWIKSLLGSFWGELFRLLSHSVYLLCKIGYRTEDNCKKDRCVSLIYQNLCFV